MIKILLVASLAAMGLRADLIREVLSEHHVEVIDAPPHRSLDVCSDAAFLDAPYAMCVETVDLSEGEPPAPGRRQRASSPRAGPMTAVWPVEVGPDKGSGTCLWRT